MCVCVCVCVSSLVNPTAPPRRLAYNVHDAVLRVRTHAPQIWDLTFTHTHTRARANTHPCARAHTHKHWQVCPWELKRRTDSDKDLSST